jgi:hypothetical protein
MKQQNFQYSIVVPSTAGDAVEKICRIGLWWAVNSTTEAGDDPAVGREKPDYRMFTVHFARTTWSRMEVVEFVPEQFILWKVVDCYLPIFKDPYLWKNHFIAWDISAEERSTRITMTHIGLIPGVECYEDCSKGWSFYVGESLYKLLTEGRGMPGSGIFAEIVIEDRKYEGLLFSKAEPVPGSAFGSILIDVKENRGEKVLAAWSVNVLDNTESIPLKGEYYMILGNQPVSGNIPPAEDLLKIIG